MVSRRPVAGKYHEGTTMPKVIDILERKKKWYFSNSSSILYSNGNGWVQGAPLAYCIGDALLVYARRFTMRKKSRFSSYSPPATKRQTRNHFLHITVQILKSEKRGKMEKKYNR